MKQILVGTDGSEGAERAIGYAANLAGRLNCELLVLDVIGGYELPGGVMRELLDAQGTSFEDLLAINSAEILRRAHDQGSGRGRNDTWKLRRRNGRQNTRPKDR